MIEVLMHKRWTPEHQHSSGERPYLRGCVVFKLGGCVIDARYTLYQKLVDFTHCSLLTAEGSKTLIYSIAFDKGEGVQFGKESIEKYIDVEIAPTLVRIIDGPR